jgi:transcriptional regulator with XRE-family HTH domain
VGRTEQPLDRDGSSVRELAHWLRELRNKSGQTYQQLAARTHYSKSTLQGAMSGRRLPTLAVVLAVVDACDGNPAEWRDYWEQIKLLDLDGFRAVSSADTTPPWAKREPCPVPPDRELDHDPSHDSSDHPTSAQPWLRRHRWTAVSALAAALVIVVIPVVLLPTLASRPAPFPDSDQHPLAPTARQGMRTYQEQEFNHNGAATFLHVDASGAGEPIGYGQFVQVSCKIHNVTVPSAAPDRYWYRIASPPWNDQYYAVANTFGNGDKLGGPYTHNTDFQVPNC